MVTSLASRRDISSNLASLYLGGRCETADWIERYWAFWNFSLTDLDPYCLGLWPREVLMKTAIRIDERRFLMTSCTSDTRIPT